MGTTHRRGGPGLRGDHRAPAEGLGHRRLLGRRRPHPGHLRAALRRRRPPRRQPRPRRRRGQRQHRPGGRPHGGPGRLARLRALPARAGARARRRRGPEDRDGRGRRAGAAVPRPRLRRGRLGCRRDVRARPAPDGGRDAAGLPRGWDDRAGQLDSGGLHRRALPDRRRARAAAAGADAAAALGRRGSRARAVRGRRPRPPRPPARLHVAVHVAGGVRRPVPRGSTARRPSRSARWSPRDRTRWRPTSPRWPVASTATAEAARVAIPAEYLEIVATRS